MNQYEESEVQLAEKRKDLRGRVLRTGESQIKQGKFKGRYQYDWIDNDGVRRHCNSWRLTEADPLPQGKRMCKPLRVLEAEIAESIHNGIDMSAKNKTLNQIFDEIIVTNKGLKLNTINGYLTSWNCNVRDTIGKKKVTDIRYSDIVKFYQSLLHDKNLSISYVGAIDCRIKSVFYVACKDKIISADPSQGALKEVRKTATKKPRRHALTKHEQAEFLKYCKYKEGESGYYLVFVVLFGTGLRASEMLGLTWDDVDFDNNVISVERNLMYLRDTRNKDEMACFHITSTKTATSKRKIPMLPEVRDALIRQQEIDLYLENGFTVDGISNFVFLNRNSRCYTIGNLDYFIYRSVEQMNEIETKRAKKENRDAQLIRKFSVHNCRHTFATRLCEKNLPVKVIQAVMGHSNVQTTLNIYAECTGDFTTDTFASLDGFF